MDDWDVSGGIDLNGPLPHHKILAIEVSGGFLDGARSSALTITLTVWAMAPESHGQRSRGIPCLCLCTSP
jgi:hypothetical protein